jgi:hypothetical protein
VSISNVGLSQTVENLPINAVPFFGGWSSLTQSEGPAQVNPMLSHQAIAFAYAQKLQEISAAVGSNLAHQSLPKKTQKK